MSELDWPKDAKTENVLGKQLKLGKPVFWQHGAFLSEAMTTATDGKLEINVPTEYD